MSVSKGGFCDPSVHRLSRTSSKPSCRDRSISSRSSLRYAVLAALLARHSNEDLLSPGTNPGIESPSNLVRLHTPPSGWPDPSFSCKAAKILAAKLL